MHTFEELPEYDDAGNKIEYTVSEISVPGYQTTIVEGNSYEFIITNEPTKTIPLTMNLGGYVWEDALAQKESLADGIKGDNDTPLKNIKVTLYTSDGRVADLLTDEDEAGITDAELMHRINPTYTDENGYYLFKGLDALKKYYVVFEYNGQRYLPTEYLNTESEQYSSVEEMVNAGLYNTDEWNETSKGTEANNAAVASLRKGVEISRNSFDRRFAEIGSYPENYKSSGSLKELFEHFGFDVSDYNPVYTQRELMGYTMDEYGNYSHTEELQLVDGYKYDEYGNETGVYSEGLISTKVREYINEYKKFPDDVGMIDIYEKIVADNSDDYSERLEIWRKLQFIEDCYIRAFTGSPANQAIDLYPVYNQFIINAKEDIADAEVANAVDYDTQTIMTEGVNYKPIYPGQLYVNLGLWRRQEFDARLFKDVYKATLKINNKTVVYDYDKRPDEEDGTNSTYWDIGVRMSDYESYYGLTYNREIYETDYLFNTSGGIAEGHPGDPLEIYITYKITIRNQSMSIMGQIKEVVDYYDEDYTFKPNLSWVMYQDSSSTVTAVNSDEYYSMMEQKQDVLNAESTSATSFITNSKNFYGDIDTKINEDTGELEFDDEYLAESRYENEKDLGSGYQKLYIRGLEDKKLASGESAYIYLTFQVNKDDGRVILDGGSYATSETPKENLAEINGYATYYKDGTELTNGVTKNSSNIAGLLDRDSNPGNLESTDLQGDRYEKNFEDDTDRAPSLRVIIDGDAIRKANGTVWEDQRTVVDGDAVIGNGIKDTDETLISGVTVQLVEKRSDGSEYIWDETTTNSEGYYEFAGFIPGDYVIRFKYGDTDSTALTSDDQPVSYNGQDYKSTVYQTELDENGNASGLAQNANTDISGNYHGYTDTSSQNESGTYGYDIYVADSSSTRYSDAKDLWSTDQWEINTGEERVYRLDEESKFETYGDYAIQGRDDVNSYSTSSVTNHKAEVLASPYSGDSSLHEELKNNTYMTAETGVIVVEFEYDRQQTDGDNGTPNNSSNSSKNYIGDNQYNSNYTLGNIDLGLTERPKAQLEIDKSVANVKVTLANGTILFDINEAANNALWQYHEEYSIDEEKKTSSEDNTNVNKGSSEYYNSDEGDIIGMYEEYYGDDSLHRYSYRTEVDDIVSSTDKGLIQLTMDQELMHGATIQVTYTVKITNVGEVDYVDDDSKDFYYRGNTTGASIVTTTANQVVDYVANNLQFDRNNATNTADGWSVILVKELIDNGLVNESVKNVIANEDLGEYTSKEFNTIIQTEDFGNGDEDGEALVPGQEISKTLVLSQLITPQNSDDDLTYSNMVEIVKTSNTVGRRMAYSVVGNQNPLADPEEVDSSVAERIVILPPFGIGEIVIYCAIGVAVAAILIAGIVLIKRKVLKA